VGKFIKKIESELICMWDVDDTLIMSDINGEISYLDVAGTMHRGRAHIVHVDQLKKHKARGYTNIVWSGNGYQHAEIIVKALNIENYVDFVMSKPVKYWDDLTDANNILTSRVYLNEK